MLDDLRRRARKGKWLRKAVALIITLMMVLGGAGIIIAQMTGT